MRRDEQVFFAALCAASVIFLFFFIAAQIQESELVTVSPRLVPQLCAILIFLLCAYKLLRSLRTSVAGVRIPVGSYRIPGLALAIPTASAFLMQWLGFWVSAGLLLAACMVFSGSRNPFIVGGFSAALAAAT